MSDPSERDLSAAFEELRAPASTAGYAARTPGLDVPSVRSRWPQAVATVLTVALAIAGAGTFLALRNARQGGAPASSTGNPPARVGAAMAYDSTAGMTVMYGGTDSSGRSLTDTWTWNGATWSTAATGPGPLVETRMVDDPADAGVLLLGIPAPAVNGSNGSVGSGCVGSGSGGIGSSGSGTATAGSAPAIATPGAVSGAPPIATAPPLPPVNPPPVIVPEPTCPPVNPATEQTWLFSSHAWHLAARGSVEITPAAGSQLTFDPTTQQVVAVSSGIFSCGPPLESAGPAIACPLVGGAGVKSGTAPAPGAPCDVTGACFGYGGSATWTWSRGYWQRQPAGAFQVSGITLLFNDPATHHATLMTQYEPVWSGQPCKLCPLPLAAPRITTWGWTGSGWNQLSQVPTTQPAPSFADASVAAIAGHIVVLTSAGQTWTFAAGQWTQDIVAGHPSTRSGAAMAEGPSETVVLYGGVDSSNLSVAFPPSPRPLYSVGSDTWVWDGHLWRHAGGTAPSAPPTPTACPDVVSVQRGCIGPPTKVPPFTPPAAAPQAGGTPLP